MDRNHAGYIVLTVLVLLFLVLFIARGSRYDSLSDKYVALEVEYSDLQEKYEEKIYVLEECVDSLESENEDLGLKLYRMEDDIGSVYEDNLVLCSYFEENDGTTLEEAHDAYDHINTFLNLYY